MRKTGEILSAARTGVLIAILAVAAVAPASLPVWAAPDQIESDLLSVSIPAGGFRIGAEASFQISSHISGFLVILDSSPAGKTVLLFPNADSGASGTPATIKSGDVITFPGTEDGFAINVPPPPGRGYVTVLICRSEVGVEAISKGVGTLQNISGAADLQERIARVLEGVTPIDPKTGRGVWTLSVASYDVRK
jgi:hypothetical protein